MNSHQGPAESGSHVLLEPELIEPISYLESSSKRVSCGAPLPQYRAVPVVLLDCLTVLLFLSRRRTGNSFSTSPENTEAPSGVCAEVRVPSTALHVFVSISGFPQ